MLATRRDLRLRPASATPRRRARRDPRGQICVFSRTRKRASFSTPPVSHCPRPRWALLHKRTEGWAAGLRLAAISLAGHPDPERFHRGVFRKQPHGLPKYLIAEMLERQPADVQHLLLHTSLLDRVNGELADLLTGRPWFGTDPSRPGRRETRLSYRWIPSGPGFATTTCSGISSGWNFAGPCPKRYRRCTGGAAEWLTRHGEVVDAIRHTQAAGDWPDAARLLADQRVQPHARRPRRRPCRRCCRRSREEPAADHPELALVSRDGWLRPGDAWTRRPPTLPSAESHAETTPADRPASAPCGDRIAEAGAGPGGEGHLAGVVEQGPVSSPHRSGGQSDEDIALDSDLRAGWR